MLYTIVVSIGLPLVYGSYLDEVDKRKSIKFNLRVFRNAQKTISHHLREKPNRKKQLAAISKKIIIPKTSFKKVKRVTLIKVRPLSIKKEKIVKISNDQLIKHYGFKIKESGVNWLAHLKRHKIKEKLVALSKKEEQRKQQKVVKNPPTIVLAKKTEKKVNSAPLAYKVKETVLAQKSNNLRVDKVEHAMASSTSLTTHKKTSYEENNYPKTGPPLNIHSSISSANKDILSPVVHQAIDRAYRQFDVNIQSKSNKKLSMDTQMGNQSNAHLQKQEKDIPKNDLTVFVYPKEKEKKNVVSSHRPSLEIDKMLSPTSNPIPPFKNSREIHQQNLVKIHPPSKNDNGTSEVSSDQINNIQTSSQVTAWPIKESANIGYGPQDFTKIDGLLTAYQAGESESSRIYNLVFVPDYDSNTSFYDYGDGGIRIEEKINGPMSILSGILNAPGMVRTRINWTLTLEDQKMHVPLLDESMFYDLLEQHNLIDKGAHLLIKLNDAVETTDLDSKYNAKLYLDKNFNKSEDDVEFVFYIGISPGNRLIKYKTFNDKNSEKVVFLGEGEIFYDKIHLWRPGLEKMALFEKKLMGQYPSELVIDGDQIRYFNKDIKASVAGTNYYEYLRPQLPTGMRQYLRFTHLDGTIFSGHWHKRKLEIPSSSFIDEVYRMFDIENLHGRCFIQLNFSKKIMGLKSQGMTAKGPMDLQTVILEKDGTVTSEITGNAEKVFFLGDEQGIANIKISYMDDSADIFQTYCSSDSYLVEHL